MSDSFPFLTVIVPVYNGAAFLDRCLDAILGSDYSSFELLVVNDCSTDDSPEISSKKGIRVLSTERRLGPAGARNLAAAEARGSVLVFVDADVVVRPSTLEMFSHHFLRRPDVSAVFGSYDDEPAEQNFLSQYKNLQHHYVHQTSSRDAFTFWSGLGAMRRDVFLDFGGFDCQKFEVPSIEDIDLGFRLYQAGHTIILDPDIQAKHLKKWEIRSHLRTEIFCRALPWSRLILENQGLMNDMNLKTSDRLSALLAGLSVLTIPLIVLHTGFIALTAVLIAAIAIVNRGLLTFFAKKRGAIFALLTFPWQFLYFSYGGATFLFVWLTHGLPRLLGFRGKYPARQTG